MAQLQAPTRGPNTKTYKYSLIIEFPRVGVVIAVGRRREGDWEGKGEMGKGRERWGRKKREIEKVRDKWNRGGVGIVRLREI